MTGEARCTKCYQPLEPGAQFCGKCGSEVEQAPAESVRPFDYTSSGSECPSCGHGNLPTARFCERCGTQLQAASGRAPAASSSGSQERSYRPQSEDPWATGPGYDRPAAADENCPRCGSFRNPNETACLNCGLPFGQATNYAGVPAAVAHQGVPAGFWIRFVAVIVDSIIISVLSVPLFVVAAISDSSAVSTLSSWLQFAVSVLYGTILLGLYGTTPGKKLFNIYVLDETGTKKLGYGRALVRELSKIVSGAILFIGYIMAAFRQDKRALHDLIADTYPTVIVRRN